MAGQSIHVMYSVSLPEKLKRLERENDALRKRIAYLEKFVRPPATYQMTQNELLDYGKTIWTPEPPFPVVFVQQVSPQQQQQRHMVPSYLQVAKRPGQ